jgi:hypothetical protein
MTTINRAVLSEHLWPGILTWFGTEYEDHPEQYTDLFDTRNSTKAYEEWVGQAGFGLAPVKAEGSPIAFDTASDTWKGTVSHQTYAMGFGITREAVEDDQYFDLVPRHTKDLKRSMRQTKEVRAAGFYDGMFADELSGDGVPVISDNHPLKSGATYSNKAAANADLNETSLEAMCIQIADYVDDRGLRLSLRPVQVIVPNGQQFVAERLFGTTGGRVGTDTHDVVAFQRMGMVAKGYALNNYLENPRSWYARTDITSGEGPVHFARRPLDVEELDGAETQVMRVVASERYSFTVIDPRGLFGAEGI